MCLRITRELLITQQIYQVQKPPALRLQTEDKSHGGHDRGRDGTKERIVEGAWC